MEPCFKNGESFVTLLFRTRHIVFIEKRSFRCGLPSADVRGGTFDIIQCERQSTISRRGRKTHASWTFASFEDTSIETLGLGKSYFFAGAETGNFVFVWRTTMRHVSEASVLLQSRSLFMLFSASKEEEK